MLCRECQCNLGSQTVCEQCVPEDATPEKLLEGELIKYAKEQKRREMDVVPSEPLIPESVLSFPKTVWYILTRPADFFRQASNARSGLSLGFAVLCMSVGLFYQNLTALQSQKTEIPELAGISDGQFYVYTGMATLMQSLVVIGLIDLLLFIVYYVVASDRVTFSKFATVLNFTFVSFLISAIPVGGDVPFLIAVGIWFALTWHGIRLGLKLSYGKSFTVILPAIVLFIIAAS